MRHSPDCVNTVFTVFCPQQSSKFKATLGRAKHRPAKWKLEVQFADAISSFRTAIPKISSALLSFGGMVSVLLFCMEYPGACRGDFSLDPISEPGAERHHNSDFSYSSSGHGRGHLGCDRICCVRGQRECVPQFQPLYRRLD